jgi:hypothetical protein
MESVQRKRKSKMENNMENTSAMQGKTFPMSKLGGAWTSFQKLVSGKATATRSKSEAASSLTSKFICEKWRPAGIGVLLTDRDQWAALGCQRQAN